MNSQSLLFSTSFLNGRLFKVFKNMLHKVIIIHRNTCHIEKASTDKNVEMNSTLKVQYWKLMLHTKEASGNHTSMHQI